MGCVMDASLPLLSQGEGQELVPFLRSEHNVSHKMKESCSMRRGRG
jgi:hypothetical protein